MILAIVNNNTVNAIVSIPDGGSQAMPYPQAYQVAIDITNTNPMPHIGWVLTSDGRLVDPNPVDSSMWITKLAMLQRFTVPERLAILAYVGSNPVSVPAILMQNIMVTTYVDLQRPDTIAGINYLANPLTLLTSDRATQILTTTPTDQELYKG